MTACPAAACADPVRVRADLRSALLAALNPDGGWAYRAGNRSRIEPTCWALLALGQAAGQAPDLDVLQRWPRRDGWLVDVAGAPPNVAFNALAALTMLLAPSAAALAEPTIDRITSARGVAMRQDPALRQDNSLQAWSWVEGTFSWVEPTAWCLLLLKQRLARSPLPGAVERIRVAEELLVDRACRAGGWNFGNAQVYGQDLLPYVPTTALALLAMQDRREDPVVQRALQGLQTDAARERSAAALALTSLCLRAYGMATAAWDRDLAELMSRERPGIGPTDDLAGMAMALCALADPPTTAFALPPRAPVRGRSS